MGSHISGCRWTPFLSCIGAWRRDGSIHICMGVSGAPAPALTYSSLNTCLKKLVFGNVPPFFLRGVRPGDSVPGPPRLCVGWLLPGLGRDVLQQDAAAASCLSYAYLRGIHHLHPPYTTQTTARGKIVSQCFRIIHVKILEVLRRYARCLWEITIDLFKQL